MPLVPDEAREPAVAGAIPKLSEIPPEIGPFRILRQIGAGGMGIVFLAQQERPTRTVALKIVHGSVISLTTLRRFEQEGEVLARLQHPGIAQIFQIGTYATRSGDLPYIAMEYVEGERLDQYLAREKPTVRARLELAARIADAVEHAHQKGVIHRDLKPGNILVTAEGQPKILDFGVARLADGDTRTTTLRTDVGALLGTLTYMSPEQASGDPKSVDTRSDIYSLGVVLYEMLANRLPYFIERTPLPEAVRVIREEEPSKLSKHDRALRGDIETIVGKALEKDRTRRYESAQELADDIRRSLADEPIHARPPSTWYQLSKFAHRNQILVGAIAAVLVTLIVGVAVATHLYLKERETNAREREALVQAKIEGQRASATAEFLISLFSGIKPAVARGADTELLQRILADARGRLATELAGQPRVEAQIRRVLGSAYKEIALFEDAEAELQRAHALLLELDGPDDRLVLETTCNLATVNVRRGNLEQAEAMLRETIERQTRLFGADDGDTLVSRNVLGDNLMRQGRHKESEDMLRAVLEVQVKRLGPVHEDVLTTKVTLAQTLGYESRDQEAYDLLKEVHLHRQQVYGDDHPQTIVALSTLSSALRELDRLDEAEEGAREALAHGLRVFGPDHQQTLSMQNNLSLLLELTEEYEEAEELLRDCLERRARVFGPDHAETLNTLNHLASLLRNLGRLDEAEPLMLELVEKTRRVLGEDHKETASARINAGILLGRQSKHAEASKMFQAVAERDRLILREDDPKRSQDLYNWAATLQNAGDNEAAEPVLREMLALVDANRLESQQFVPAARNALAKVLEERGAHAEADPLFQAALEERRRRHGAVHAETAYSLADYGDALLARGDAAGAEPLLEELVKVREKLAKDPPWMLPYARQAYGRCLAHLGRYADAEAQIVAACEAFTKLTEAPAAAARETRASMLELYDLWETAGPDQGIAARAARWEAKFPTER